MDNSYLDHGLETEDWDNKQYLPPNYVPQTPGVLINSSIVQNIVVPMAFPMIDRNLKKFNGFMHEDGTKFIAEFKSYLTLTGVVTLPRGQLQRSICNCKGLPLFGSTHYIRR